MIIDLLFTSFISIIKISSYIGKFDVWPCPCVHIHSHSVFSDVYPRLHLPTEALLPYYSVFFYLLFDVMSFFRFCYPWSRLLYFLFPFIAIMASSQLCCSRFHRCRCRCCRRHHHRVIYNVSLIAFQLKFIF